MSARDLGGRFLSVENALYSETGMKWYPVSSSNVSEVGYNLLERKLGVRFTNGSEYEYYDVDEPTFFALRDATSVGKYLNAGIKGRYAFERVS